MLQVNKSISFTGISSVEIEENGSKTIKQIAYMNANIPDKGDFSINKSIQDRELFDKYSSEVFKDFNEFEKHVYELSKGMINE